MSLKASKQQTNLVRQTLADSIIAVGNPLSQKNRLSATTSLFSSDVQVSILTGDNREVLRGVAAETFQCCVTSPPYWGLRDYDHAAQIGTESSPVKYVANLVEVFREVRRTLAVNGTLWLNVGDGYARNGGTGRHGPNAIVGNTRKMIQKRNCKVPDCWGLKDKDLMGLPWRVAFALQEDGWFLRSRITWVKRTAMPESVRDRPTSASEEIFLFSKSPRYFYNPEGVREESGANLRNFWVLGPDPTNNGHPATFPRELARRCILLGSSRGDRVLDPFGGSGTTGLAASELERNAVLIEINPSYSRISKDRIHGA
jgi:site-specific DNA-methyltransferase (cytosine-N4-specific)